MLTKKDFIIYLAKGGNVSFNKPIKLNKLQISKLSEDQKAGRQAIIIEGRQGYLDRDGFWKPEPIK